MYELKWEKSGTGEDFDSWMPISACGSFSNFTRVDVPEGWPVEGQDDTYEFDIWFKAYDTSFGNNPLDLEAQANGYRYNCLVQIRGNDSGYLSDAVLPNPVPCETKEDAIAYFEQVRDKLESGEIDVAQMYERKFS